MEELNKARISVTIHAVAAILVAFITSSQVTGYAGLGLGLVVLVVLGFALERGLGKRREVVGCERGLYLSATLACWGYLPL